MSLSITEIKADTEAALHGTTINKVRNVYGLLNRAARRVVSDIDPAETKRVIPITSPLFTGIYDYPCPSDLKGDRIVDIRSQSPRPSGGAYPGIYGMGSYQQTYSKEFIYSVPSFADIISTIRWSNGIKTLRISAGYQSPITLTPASVLTGWTLGGTATNLLLDTQNFYEGSSSFRFDVGTGTGYIETSTLDTVDLTNIKDIGSLFNLVYLPVSALTSVELRWGTNSTNYWTATATADHATNAYQLGWNLSEFHWPATAVGTPDITNIKYLRVSYTVSAPIAGVRMDSVTAQLGRIYEMEYYSKFMFRDGITGAFKEKVTADSDLLNLDVDSYEVFLSCFLWMLAQQLQGLDANVADGPHYENAYRENLQRYVMTHRSEVTPPITPYYQMPRKRSLQGRIWYR